MQHEKSFVAVIQFNLLKTVHSHCRIPTGRSSARGWWESPSAFPTSNRRKQCLTWWTSATTWAQSSRRT